MENKEIAISTEQIKKFLAGLEALKVEEPDATEALLAADPEFKRKVDAAVKSPGVALTYSGYSKMRKAMLEANKAVAERRRKVKFYSVGNNAAGETATIYRMLGLGQRPFLVQDFIPNIEIAGNRLTLQQQGTDSSPAGTVDPSGEGEPKPTKVINHLSNDQTARKIAVTLLYTEEAKTYLAQRLIDFLTLQLVATVEESIANAVESLMLSASVPFNPAPYAASVPQANFVDLANLMIAQEEELILYQNRRTLSLCDMVLLNNASYNSLLTLKTSFGQRLYRSFEEAIPAASVIIKAPSLAHPVMVARSQEWFLGIFPDITIYNERVVDGANDNNTYRFTVEAMIALQFTRRVSTTVQTSGYSRVGTAADITTISV